MLKLAILALTTLGAAHAGTYTCSLLIGGVAQPTVTTATSCQSGNFPAGPAAIATPGSVATFGSSGSNLFATASMVDTVTISGGSGQGLFVYFVSSTCGMAAGLCTGALGGWIGVPFTFDVPIPIALSIANSDNVSSAGPAALGVSARIALSGALRTGSPVDALSSPFALPFVGLPGAFISAGPSRELGFFALAAEVPEPATFFLVALVLGFGVAAIRARRR